MPNLFRVSYFLAKAMRRPYWDKGGLQLYQNKKLRSVIDNAYRNVPFYHSKFRDAGIKPADIKTVDDLSKLPVFMKAEFRREDPRRLVSLQHDISHLKTETTSGSTGQPFTTYLSRSEIDWRKAIYMRANISCGQRLRDRWVVITSPHHFSDTTGIQRRLGIYAQTCVSVFEGVDEQMRLIAELNPAVLDGYSGSLLLIARKIEEKRLKTIRPRIVFGTADLLNSEEQQFMERVFDAPYYDQFGCAEIDRSAWQCPEKVGYHMDIDSVVTQFVDEEGNDVAPGERGEVVYTSLFNYAMPFIRYGVGDLGVPSDEQCPCGRNLPLMSAVEGRRDSVLILPDGRLLSPMSFRIAVSKFFDDITHYRLVQKKVDLLELYVEKKNDVNDEEAFEANLVAHVSNVLDLEKARVKIIVHFVDSVPLSQTGKLAAIVSELKP
jgi:phenylacetate-CoA ligase